MLIDRILFPIVSLGPGSRVVIWTAGCSKRCTGCANPELWSTEGRQQRSVSDIVKVIRGITKYSGSPPDGFTLTGGDPLEQPEETIGLIEELSMISEDILVYTGYAESELPSVLGGELYGRLRAAAGVLIDGRYVEALNDAKCVLRGSLNQQMIFYREALRPLYESYISEGRKIQNVMMGDRFISVGIHGEKG